MFSKRPMGFMCVSRWAWGGLCSLCWAGRTPRDPAHSGGAGGRRRSVQLCSQQLCRNLRWYSQSGGWRWDHASVFHMKLVFLSNFFLKWKFALPSTAGPLLSEAPVDVTASVGENITLPCVARGFPQPTVTWRRQNGRQILTRTDSHSRTMQLENGHLLIQSELSMKHYHSKELWSAAQANTASWLPCTDWHDWNFLSDYI